MKQLAAILLFSCLGVQAHCQFMRLDTDSENTISDYITDYKDENSIVGLSVGVVKNGEIVYLRGFGSADLENDIDANEHTLYRLASVSKAITGLMAMRLVDAEQLDLDLDIRDYVPEYPEKPEGVITSEELLSHESGIIHYSGTADGQYCSESYNTSARNDYIDNHVDYYDPIEALDIFKDQQICFTPGDHYQYTTWGFCLMGAVLQRAANKPFEEILFDEINETLCLPNLQPELQIHSPYPNETIGYEFDSEGNTITTPSNLTDYTDISYKVPGGGMISSVVDLSLIVKGVVNHELMDENMVDFWGSNHTPTDGEVSYYGYGINSGMRDGNRLFSHSGGQAKAAAIIYFSPDNKNGLAIMANTRGVSLWDLARDIYDYLPNVSIEGEAYQIPESNIFNLPFEYANCGTSSTDQILDFEANLYPNPAENSIRLTWSSVAKASDIRISNIYGHEQSADYSEDQNRIDINISHLPSGVYLIQFKLKNKILNKRFIKV